MATNQSSTRWTREDLHDAREGQTPSVRRGEGRTFAVLGATGVQGGATVRALRAAGAQVRALTRDPGSDRAQAVVAAGARAVRARLDDVDSMRAAFSGTDGVFAVTTFDGPGGTQEEVAQGRRIGQAAQDAGVGVVFTSVGGADRDSGVAHFDSKRRVELDLAHLGLPFLRVVRPTFFMDNLDQGGPVVQDGTVVFRSPLQPGVPVQMIASDDIGTVAASMLLEPMSAPAEVEIAGDELTAEQIADAYGRHLGLPARYEPLPLSVLDGTPELKAMFTWFTHLPAYQADWDATRALAPSVMNLATRLTRRG